MDNTRKTKRIRVTTIVELEIPEEIIISRNNEYDTLDFRDGRQLLPTEPQWMIDQPPKKPDGNWNLKPISASEMEKFGIQMVEHIERTIELSKN